MIFLENGQIIAIIKSVIKLCNQNSDCWNQVQYKLKPGAVYDLLMKFINQVGNLRVCSGKTESGIIYFNFDKQASSSCFETNLYKRNNIFISRSTSVKFHFMDCI